MKTRKLNTDQTVVQQNGGGCCGPAPQVQTQAAPSACCGNDLQAKEETVLEQVGGCC